MNPCYICRKPTGIPIHVPSNPRIVFMACSYEHAETIVLNDLALMFLSGHASAVAALSLTEDASSPAPDAGTTQAAQTSSEPETITSGKTTWRESVT